MEDYTVLEVRMTLVPLGVSLDLFNHAFSGDELPSPKTGRRSGRI